MSLDGLQLGHYRLLRLVGSGGMGEVYLAEDPRISRQVAVKVIRTESSTYANTLSDHDAARLFQREAKAIAMLDHPHILPLYDYGEEQLNGAVFTYLVMPFRPEGSLTNWLRQRGDQLLPIGDVEHFIHQAATALQYAHDRQIIHQDVKPSNFLIRENRDLPNRPDLLLTDFGVAKLSTATSSVSHSIRGTPTYMAPEQWSGDPVPATDQYALAVMAYELLVGRPPFHGPPMRMMYLHTNMPVQPPSTLNPQLSADVDAVFLCALSKQPQQRFASISAFANAFRQAMQGVDAPTIIKTPTPAESKDMHVTLAISQAEAINGTQRKLTLPDGRQIQVIVPANAYDGQVLRLDALSDPSSPGGPRVSVGVLMLTLAVKQVAASVTPFVGNDDRLFPASDPNLLKTLPGSNPNLQAATQAASNVNQFHAQVTPIPPIYVRPQPPPKKESAGVKVGVLVGLALVIVLASAGFFFYTTLNNQSNNSANGTATAQANTAQGNLTATGQANALSTARASGAATDQANSLATAQANGIASAQITATAAANATAQANANATVTASHSSDPYPPYTGTLALSDPLSSNNQGNGWKEYSDSLSACSFTGNAYLVRETKSKYYADCFSNPYFGNFAYQVQMQIAQGDCGGIIFRADSTLTQFYFFRVCQDGSYALLRYVDNTNTNAVQLAAGTSNAIQGGTGVTNVIAAVANGGNISLYANKQLIASAVDNNYSLGHIAVFAQSEGNLTNVIFSNLMVWTM